MSATIPVELRIAGEEDQALAAAPQRALDDVASDSKRLRLPEQTVPHRLQSVACLDGIDGRPQPAEFVGQASCVHPVDDPISYHRSAMDDEALLSAWQGGDASAGEVLLARHFEPLYAFFRGKIEGDVDDLIQRTFLACVEGRDRVRQGSSVKAYLFAVARHELYDHLQALARRRGRTVTATTSIVDLLPSPSEVAAGSERDRMLLDALRRLPIDLQIVLELYFFEEMTTREIGEVLDVPHATVRSRMKRARETLAVQFAELGGTTAEPLMLRRSRK